VKRSHRLLKDADFQVVLAKKIQVKSPEFTIYGFKKQMGETRIGISVSKKIGIAVVRNKIRRQIKMMISKHVVLKEPIDYVVIVRQVYLEKTFLENQNHLISQLSTLRRKLT
jgi:ribonuclease P protein component